MMNMIEKILCMIVVLNSGIAAAEPSKPNILFIVTGDPSETTDVSSEHPEKVIELANKMNAF